MQQLTAQRPSFLKGTTFLLALGLACVMTAQGFAYQVILQDNKFSTSGAGAQKKMIIVNNQTEPVALEIIPVKRLIDEKGVETIETIPEDWFLIYPSQLVLNPGEEEIVRLVWNNKVKVDNELPFRFVVREIKIKDPSEEERRQKFDGYAAKIDILTQYSQSAYVTAPGALPRVLVKEPEFLQTAQGKQVRVVFENTGRSRKVMPDLNLKIIPLAANGSEDPNQKPLEFIRVATVNLFPNSKRIFELPVPADFTSSKVRVEYTFKLID
jgi:fimbrial chaperone protein